eukprot:11457809-Karenia_brevis.AAC.1
MALDSKAFFQVRVAEVGLTEFWPAFELLGLGTMASFAFSCNFVPGNADETPFLEMALRLLGEEMERKLVPLRRLHFEACSLVAADSHRKSSVQDDEGRARKLPREELNARLQATRASLPGLDLTNEAEPSHTLMDKYVSMKETGDLRLI